MNMLVAETGQRPTSEGRQNKPVSVVSVLVVDDHPVVRFGISMLLNGNAGLTVVGEASTCAQAWEMVVGLQPDIVLVDLELADANACELIAKMELGGVNGRVVVYTAHDEESRVLEALRSGAHGYIIKGSTAERLIDAICTVAGGGSYLDPAVASKVIGRVGRSHERRAPRSRELTEREQVVLRGLAAGKPNKIIADDLFISEGTVKYHIKSLFTKLQVNNRTQLVMAAITQGLIIF